MPTESPRYPWKPLLDFATAAFERAGMESADAFLCADGIVSADLRGITTHGLVRLPIYARNLRDGTVSPTAQPEILQESAGTALIDGGNAMGYVVATRAMELAIAKARQSGVGAVTVRNSNHFGTCAHYAMLAAEQGMIGISATNASPAMAPWGGIEPRVGNNPLSIAAPSGEAFPAVLDMAMTVVARGRIRLAQMNGQEIPLGWGLDAAGKATTDAGEVLSGSLLPVGTYKGFGLAVMVDMLTAMLSGAALSPELANMGFTVGAEEHLTHGAMQPGVGTGHFFLALDVQRFLPLEAFKARVAQYAALLRLTPRAPGVDAIYMPGEIEWQVEQDRRTNGLPLDGTILRELQAFAAAEGVPLPV